MKITIVKKNKFESVDRGHMFTHKGRWVVIILKDKDTDLYRIGQLQSGITWPESYSLQGILDMLNRNPDDFEFLGQAEKIITV